MFGFYDYFLGWWVRYKLLDSGQQYDKLVEKMHPERKIYEKVLATKSLMRDVSELCAISGGFGTIENYMNAANLDCRMHLIKKPFFFISSEDDQFYGKKIIPYDQVHENILLGVTQRGGHCGFIEGRIIPTGQWYTKPAMQFLNHFTRINKEQSTAD